MGTVGNQPPRTDYRWKLNEYCDEIQSIAKSRKLTFDQVLEAHKVMLQDAAYSSSLQSGDNHDEHIAGMRDVLFEISEAIRPAERVDF